MSALPAAFASGLQPGQLHQAADAVLAARLAKRTKVVPHARAPIGAVAQLETLSNQPGQARVVLTALAGRSAKPFVEAARGDRHHPAHGAGGPPAVALKEIAQSAKRCREMRAAAIAGPFLERGRYGGRS